MRWLMSGILFGLGAVLLHPFSGGAFIGTAHASPARTPWESALDPFWKLTPLGGAVLFAGVGCVVLAVAVLFGSRGASGRQPPAGHERRKDAAPGAWGRLLQVAFLLNVLLAAVLILAVSIASRRSAPDGTVGHIFLLACLVAGLGSILALTLILVRKRRLVFAATLALHLVEAGSLTAVYLKGLGG